MKINIVSIELSINYDYEGECIVVTDNTFEGTPGSIDFLGNKKSRIDINSVDEVIEILEDFKKKFEIVKQMEAK